MKNYERPMIQLTEEMMESVYTASGDTTADNNGEQTKEICRFGRKSVKKNGKDCVKCVASGGTSIARTTQDVPGLHAIDPSQCPDHMPAQS